MKYPNEFDLGKFIDVHDEPISTRTGYHVLDLPDRSAVRIVAMITNKEKVYVATEESVYVLENGKFEKIEFKILPDLS